MEPFEAVPVGIRRASRELPGLVDTAAAGSPVVISRTGRPLAALISTADYERLQELERRDEGLQAIFRGPRHPHPPVDDPEDPRGLDSIGSELMTEGRDHHLPWWEFDPDEKPVPMTAGSWGAADEAELIANGEREAILREDTEPSLVTLGQLAAAQEPIRCPSGISLSRRSVLAALIALLLGCAAAFSVGWSHGRSLVDADVVSMTRTRSHS